MVLKDPTKADFVKYFEALLTYCREVRLAHPVRAKKGLSRYEHELYTLYYNTILNYFLNGHNGYCESYARKYPPLETLGNEGDGSFIQRPLVTLFISDAIGLVAAKDAFANLLTVQPESIQFLTREEFEEWQSNRAPERNWFWRHRVYKKLTMEFGPYTIHPETKKWLSSKFAFDDSRPYHALHASTHAGPLAGHGVSYLYTVTGNSIEYYAQLGSWVS